MNGPELDYEATLRALQGLVGRRVAVTVGNADASFLAAMMAGPLHSADVTDQGQLAPGAPDGEALVFVVGRQGYTEQLATFVVWRDGFEWGREYEREHGAEVFFSVASVTIRVAPSPPSEV